MIAADYPDHFLGSIPALAGSEIVLRPDDSTRTIASLINAYVHPALATTLYRAEEIVRDQHGWRGNVLIGHINGGVARIGKTKAFDTIESGPLFGTHACAAADDDKVIAIDVGGTTAKVSAVRDGRAVFRDSGDLFGIPLKLDLPLLHSIALGGGSVARVAGGAVTLGPDSMGAAPGPGLLRPGRPQRHPHRRVPGQRVHLGDRLPRRPARPGYRSGRGHVLLGHGGDRGDERGGELREPGQVRLG